MRINVRTWSDQYCKRYFKLDLYSIITQFFPLFDWPCILTPTLVYPLTEENLAKAKSTEKMALWQIKDVIAKEGRDIAGLILEPIQGQGGDNHFRAEFIHEIRQICSENEQLV
jgi:L-lysine 6-transaminase